MHCVRLTSETGRVLHTHSQPMMINSIRTDFWVDRLHANAKCFVFKIRLCIAICVPAYADELVSRVYFVVLFWIIGVYADVLDEIDAKKTIYQKYSTQNISQWLQRTKLRMNRRTKAEPYQPKRSKYKHASYTTALCLCIRDVSFVHAQENTSNCVSMSQLSHVFRCIK